MITRRPRAERTPVEAGYEGSPELEFPEIQTKKRPHSLLVSFNYAIEGVIHVLRRERNMRVHFALSTVVLVFAFTYDVTKLELMALLLAISFVLIAEMINTAVEEMIDLSTKAYDPRAKIAKDVAAGAVLVASVVAATIGYLVFVDRIRSPTYHLLNEVRAIPATLTIIALALTVIAVITVKAISGRGTPLRGGLPSGHAAVAFGSWTAITFISEEFQHRVLVSTLAFLMAFLVAQTRVESGIHSTREVAFGGVLGTLVTLLLFQTLT
ncbi:MAG: diacylglycerol kinase [Actinomycetota bacterium]|nr:diacylglycerol kinase [Actinomycetota bacterium]